MALSFNQNEEDIQKETAEFAETIRSFLHAINNKLFVISGKAQLLASLAEDFHTQQDLEFIFAKIQQVSQMLKEVYSISRRYQGSMQPADHSPVKIEDNSAASKPIESNRILVADGDFLNLGVLIDLLEGEGNLVWAAQNYAALKNQILSNAFHYLILDENLPGLDLDDLVLNIKLLKDRSEPKVILMTYGAQEMSFITCIQKPVFIEKLDPYITHTSK
jgi:CheY-like chemotaxis protein